MDQMKTSKLQLTRLACGLSQSQLAAAANINPRMLQYYALHCKLEDILPDGETTDLLEQYKAMM